MDILCLGIFVTDVLGKPIERMPERGKLELIDELELHTGGCANNTAIGLARLGCAVGGLGKVGTDGLGDFVLRDLQENNVDVRGLVRDEKATTSFTFVMIAPDGERSFFHYVGANGRLCYEDMDFELVRESKILHVAGANLMPGFDGQPMAQVLRDAKRVGVVTSLDTAWDSTGQWLQLIEPCLPHVDIFLPSIEEARMISRQEDPQDVAQFFLDYGIATVGLKMGEEGCYMRTADEEIRVPIYPVSMVDATGAGDAFVAGFLAGMLKGWDLEKSAKLGNATGAAAVTAIGTTTGIRDLDTVLAIMEQ